MSKLLSKIHFKAVPVFMAIILELSFCQLFIPKTQALDISLVKARDALENELSITSEKPEFAFPAVTEPPLQYIPDISIGPVPELTNTAAVQLLKAQIASGIEPVIILPARRVITIGDPGVYKNGLDITRSLTLDLYGRTLEITTTSYLASGIKIGDGKTLTIKDSIGGGNLIINNNGYGCGAGINTNNTTLNILSGNISIKNSADSNSAGIGGIDLSYDAFYGSSRDDINFIKCGRVNIYGGVVTVESRGGAAIGGAVADENIETGGNVCIYGGIVTATSESGAGIGGGFGNNGDSVRISGGIVTATSKYSAGIGGGGWGDGGDINISGGNVTATSEYGAGIGGGNCQGTGGNVSISGGIVTATGEYGAGIGGGNDGNGGNVRISGGTVTASSKYGAGIGGGNAGNGGDVRISGGTVTASSTESAGIGGGQSSTNSITRGGALTINGGSVLPISSNGVNRITNAVYSATDGINYISMATITVTNTPAIGVHTYSRFNMLEGVNITVGNYRAITGADGKAFIWINNPIKKTVFLDKAGYSDAKGVISLIEGEGVGLHVAMTSNRLDKHIPIF